ncbi:MAG: cell division protein SepF [Candidatus Aenigmarchaeota archaeon]|nr:cell division protein SepF [Candidatus Aenigmarchaeota archaeon]
MVFDLIFGREREEDEDKEAFVEIDKTGEEGRKIQVRVESLEEYADTDRVQKLLREGNIVFLKIKPLRDKDLGELKRAVAKIKKTITAMNGDIVGVDENYLIITPEFARVFRGEATGQV